MCWEIVTFIEIHWYNWRGRTAALKQTLFPVLLQHVFLALDRASQLTRCHWSWDKLKVSNVLFILISRGIFWTNLHFYCDFCSHRVQSHQRTHQQFFPDAIIITVWSIFMHFKKRGHNIYYINHIFFCLFSFKVFHILHLAVALSSLLL